MATYIYGCSNKDHPRWKVDHRMNIELLGECHLCGEKLHRIPQMFRFGLPPLELLREWGERNWAKKLRGEKREERYDEVRTDRGKPQRDFGARN